MSRVDAGLAADIVAGTTRVVPLPADHLGWRREAIVLRDDGGVLRAYLNRCQHLPIPLDGGGRAFLTADGKFLLCRTHGATYRLDDGVCVLGPCIGAALVSLELVHDGARMWIVLEGADPRD